MNESTTARVQQIVSDSLIVSITGHVATFEVTRGPENYFDAELLRDIADQAQRVQSDAGARAIVLCSRGKHFCAGANFHEGALRDDRARAARDVYEQGIRLFEIGIPIVAAVQGAAVGGGLGLACAADLRVASSRSRFQANFASLGFHHGFGLSVTLPRIVGDQRALDLLVTSRRLGGEEAYALGLVDRLADDGEERIVAASLAADIAALAPLAVRSIKRTLRRGSLDDVRAALDIELSEQADLWETNDSTIGIAAARARQVPIFKGD